MQEASCNACAGYAIWPLAHIINFRFVPNSHRVFYINVITVRAISVQPAAASREACLAAADGFAVIWQEFLTDFYQLTLGRRLFEFIVAGLKNMKQVLD